jgi:nucleoside phosphorylase
MTRTVERSDGLVFVAAVREELGDLAGSTLGVGVVAAAAAAARLMATQTPRRVVMVGTVGAYAGGPAIGSVVAADTIVMASGVEALGLGYVPRAPGPLRCETSTTSAFGVPAVTVVTALAITTDPGLATKLGALGAVEHMEAYGVAWACAQANVPFSAVFGVTNVVGPDAHQQWLRHRDDVQSKVREVAARALSVHGTNG